MAEQHSGAFKHRAVFKVTAQPAAALGANPCIAFKPGIANMFEITDDALLQAGKPAAHGLYAGDHVLPASVPAPAVGCKARQPMSRRYCWPSKWVRATAS